MVGVLVVALTRWLGGRAACKPLIIIGLFEVLAGYGLLWLMPSLKGTGYFLSGIGVIVLLAGIGLGAEMSRRISVAAIGLAGICSGAAPGLLGGLRVILFKDEIGIFHAALAQIFFALLCLIALGTSRWWQTLLTRHTPLTDDKNIRRFLLATTPLISGNWCSAQPCATNMWQPGDS